MWEWASRLCVHPATVLMKSAVLHLVPEWVADIQACASRWGLLVMYNCLKIAWAHWTMNCWKWEFICEPTRKESHHPQGLMYSIIFPCLWLPCSGGVPGNPFGCAPWSYPALQAKECLLVQSTLCCHIDSTCPNPTPPLKSISVLCYMNSWSRLFS